MPGYEPLHTEYTKPVNVLFRLSPADTRFLKSRIEQAVSKDTGVNLIFVRMDGAFSLTSSTERGKQIKCIGFKNGIRVETEQQGYNGKWSHVELVYGMDSFAHMKKFVETVEKTGQLLLL